MLITVNLKRSKAILRNVFEKSAALQSVVDEFIINKLPQRLVNNYIITSPFITESVTLLPVFIAYNCVSDVNFVIWHKTYGLLRTLYQGYKPVRLLFSAAMHYNTEVCILLLRFVHFDDFLNRALFGMSTSKFRRIIILALASLGEVFGEPYGKQLILPNKPVLFMVAKNCNNRFLNSMQSERYGSPQNPMLYDLILNNNVNFIMDKESVPPSADCIQVSLADLNAYLNRTNTLQNRKVLRIKS